MAPKAKLGCVFYRTESGREPVREWLKSLDDDACHAIGEDIRRVQWRWPVSGPLVDSFGDGLYEVRTSLASREFRVIFCIAESSMVLLHGFIKKTQRTPTREVSLARSRKKDIDDEK